jgi:phosphoesterase RecJ-like protein
MIPSPSNSDGPAAVAAALRAADRLIVTSHVRPDGDAIGSTVALTLALRAFGKQATAVLRDRLPDPYPDFPCAAEVQSADTLPDDGATVVVLECGDLERTGLAGIEHHPVVNIDHHPGNTGFGIARWFDGSAAACAEMVFALIRDLGVTVTADMAQHLYVAIVTDTGAFRYPGVSPRTFEICADLLRAGADPVTVARLLYDGHTLARLRLQAAVLATLDVVDDTIACLTVDDGTIAGAGATAEDTDGLINIPLSVKRITAAAFFKQGEPGQYRVSLRSKGAIDVGQIARHFGGGGHKNASGCTLTGPLDEVRATILAELRPEVARHAPGDGARRA